MTYSYVTLDTPFGEFGLTCLIHIQHIHFGDGRIRFQHMRNTIACMQYSDSNREHTDSRCNFTVHLTVNSINGQSVTALNQSESNYFYFFSLYTQVLMYWTRALIC